MADERSLDIGIKLLEQMSKEELVRLLVDDAKNWLAHDGLWFQAIEKTHGMEAAMDADREAWRYFTVIEAKRIMTRSSARRSAPRGATSRWRATWCCSTCR